MMKTLLNFINYWYFRYLLVTELYMVEKWERVMIHIVFAIMLTFLSLFNTAVVLGLVTWATQSMQLFNDPSLTNHINPPSTHIEF